MTSSELHHGKKKSKNLGHALDRVKLLTQQIPNTLGRKPMPLNLTYILKNRFQLPCNYPTRATYRDQLSLVVNQLMKPFRGLRKE